MPDQEVLVAKIKEEDYEKSNNGLWAVEPNEANTVVTLKVEGAKNAEANATVSFTLTEIKDGTTLSEQSNEKIKLNEIKDGNATVTVPKKAGNYSLILKSGDKSQSITVNVIDVSLLKKENIKFEEIQDEDRKALTGDVKDNTEEVYKTENKPTFENNNRTITFKGNVNTMKGDKKYRVRLNVSKTDSKDLIVAYLDNGKVVRITPSIVEEASDTILLFDLEASVATTKLVVAPSGSVDAQIKNEINKESGNFAIVKFTSTSILWIDRNNNKGANIANATGMGVNALANQSTENGPITKVELDEQDETLVKIGAKISELKEYCFDKDTLKEGGTENKGKWVGIDLRVIRDNINTATMVSCDDTNVIIDNGTNHNSHVNSQKRFL